jgi:hypothetical protein
MARARHLSPEELAKARVARRRRWRRRVLVAAVLLLGVWLLFTRSPLTRTLVLKRLGDQIGARLEARAVTIGADGSLIIDDLRGIAPGVKGPAAVFVEAKRVTAHLSGADAILGTLTIRSIEIDSPVIRISQSIDSEKLNLGTLRIPSIEGGGGANVPEILVHDGRVELGEHNDESYTMLKRIDIDGAVVPAPDRAAGGYVVSFRQIGTPAEGPALSVQGVLSDTELSLKIGSVSFADWPPSAVPAPLRRQFAQLGLEGRVKHAEISYPFDGKPFGTFEVEHVAMNLPVQANTEIGTESVALAAGLPPSYLRLRETSGVITLSTEEITANLRGRLEELPYDVTFKILGTDIESSPFNCQFVSEKFRLGKDPKVLRFVGEIARRRLREFGPPTGLVSTTVNISRGPPVNGAPAPVRVSGMIEATDATAAFHKFPYEFQNITARIRFSDEAIELLSVIGETPTGAQLSAFGRIAPPTENAEAAIRVHVVNALIDEKLEEAMGPRRKALEEVFSDARYRQLVDAGLVLTPEHAAELNDELRTARAAGDAPRIARLEEHLKAPVFKYRGRATIDVFVGRQAGEDGHWDDRVDVHIDEAGALPAKFPYPLHASNVDIVIANDLVTVKNGEYHGLPGGTAAIEARADLAKLLDPDAHFAPDVTIRASDVPSDTLLVNAIALAADRAGESASARVRQILTDLTLSGPVSCVASVAPNADGEAGFDAKAQLRGMRAAPAPSGTPSELEITGIVGDVHVTQEGFTLELDGDVRRGSDSVGTAEVKSSFAFGTGGTPRGSSSEFSVSNLDLAAPAEDLVQILSPRAATKLRELRAAHKPSGVLDLGARVRDEGGVVNSVEIDVSALRDVRLTESGSEYQLTSQSGKARILPPLDDAQPTRLTFDNLRTSLRLDGEDAGTLNAVGELTLAKGGKAETGDVTLAAVGLKLESSMVRRALESSLGPRVEAIYKENKPSGLFDLTLRAWKEPERWQFSGRATPFSLAFDSAGSRVAFDRMEGVLELEGRQGRFVGLRGYAPEWSASADGEWFAAPSGSITVQTGFGFKGTGFPTTFRAALPDELRGVLDQIGFSCVGEFEVKDANLRLTQIPGGGRTFDSRGTVALTGASVVTGVTVDKCDGVLDFAVSRDQAGRPLSYRIATAMDRMRVAGVNMTAGRTVVENGEREGEVLIPLMEADCYGGRFGGEGILRKEPVPILAPPAAIASATAAATGVPVPAPSPPLHYDLQLRLSGVRFAPVLADIDAARGKKSRELTPADPESRGILDADLSLGGLAGVPESRSGRLTATIGGGEVVNVPLLVPLVRFSNLQLPLSEKVEIARAIGYINGPQLTFEHVSIATPSVAVAGYGTVGWPDLELDLEMNSRSQARIPIVSWALESLRDEFISTRIRGTLAEPKLSTKQFAGTERFLDKLFGRMSERDQRMEGIQRESIRDPVRVKVRPKTDLATVRERPGGELGAADDE